MSKGDATRRAVVARAMSVARSTGLAGLTIGRLSDEMSLSKSGLFAHFGSKESLQVAVVEEAQRQFVEQVVSPALESRRGEPRVRALFEKWLAWGRQDGGCPFVGMATELDDQQGPAREALASAERDWQDALAQAARIAIEEKHFASALDPRQFAFEMLGIMLSFHLMHRLLGDSNAEKRARAAFEALLSRNRGDARPSAPPRRAGKRTSTSS